MQHPRWCSSVPALCGSKGSARSPLIPQSEKMSFISDENRSRFHVQPLLLTEPGGWAKSGLAPLETLLPPACPGMVRFAANLWAPNPEEEEEVMLATYFWAILLFPRELAIFSVIALGNS